MSSFVKFVCKHAVKCFERFQVTGSEHGTCWIVSLAACRRAERSLANFARPQERTGGVNDSLEREAQGAWHPFMHSKDMHRVSGMIKTQSHLSGPISQGEVLWLRIWNTDLLQSKSIKRTSKPMQMARWLRFEVHEDVSAHFFGVKTGIFGGSHSICRTSAQSTVLLICTKYWANHKTSHSPQETTSKTKQTEKSHEESQSKKRQTSQTNKMKGRQANQKAI